jgi:hypothetical protein
MIKALANRLSAPVSSYPAISDEQQVCAVLGLTRRELKILIKSRHIPVLGTPRRRTQKRFATAQILELCDDVEWLSRARDIISAGWRKMNAATRKAKSDRREEVALCNS